MEFLQSARVVTLEHLAARMSQIAVGRDIIVYNGVLDTRNVEQNPMRFESLIAILCQEGTLSVEVDLQTINLKRGTLLILRPQNFVSFMDVSECCIINAVACSRPMVEEFLLRSTEMLPLLLHLSNFPAVDLNEGQQKRITEYFSMICTLIQSGITSNLSRKVGCLLKASLYEMLDNFVISSKSRPHTRREELTSRFLTLVSENFINRRDVAFYANKIGVSAKHLSSVVKSVGGRTAGDWIETYVVLEAKMLLANTDLSINEISQKLNFRSQALFGKYFRHVTHMSPSGFRKSLVFTGCNEGDAADDGR